MGLTNYILALLKHPDLTRADPVKGAERFSIREDWARYYLVQERARRRAMK